MFFGEFVRQNKKLCIIVCSGTAAGIITPNVIGPILDNVNLNQPSNDCLTGIDITPTDYRVPFAIADAAFLG